ncbi:MAG TPA: divalent metal cation transporter [Lacibacter sp.]|nr:divalent metal cation transporter [Lacibacter sp.]
MALQSRPSPTTNRLLAAAFLMATSAIGPGFLTQTTVFTQQLLAAMGFVILASVMIDLVVQLNIWELLHAHRKTAAQLANDYLPGSGHVLTLLVCFGGLAFNIGNISGAGLGLQALTGMPVHTGAMLSALLALLLFSAQRALRAMDRLVQVLGVLMLVLMLVVVARSTPPAGELLQGILFPQTISWTAIITLVGGTVGGYISFAGAHRLLAEPEPLTTAQVRRSAISGILLTSLMRLLLFAAVLGVLLQGFIPDAANPTASVFGKALGTAGYRIFGCILWAAAMTSIVGAAFTSISFMQNLHPAIAARKQTATMVFIIIYALIFQVWGKPVTILVWAGAINGIILPLA